MTSLHQAFNSLRKKRVKKDVTAPEYSTRNTIDEAGKESFPSSDPPAWTLGSNPHAHLSKEDKAKDIAFILTQEHITIRNVVHMVSHIIKQLQNGDAIDTTLLKNISDFFLKYVDQSHHKKEELIFSAMHVGEERPSDYILHDLEIEHKHGKRVHEKLAQWLTKNNADEKELLSILKDMVNLHHNHTKKEEEYVFALINKVLDRDRQDMFLQEFQRIQAALGQQVFEKLVEFSKRNH